MTLSKPDKELVTRLEAHEHCFDLGNGFGVTWADQATIDDPGLPAIVELSLGVEGGRLVVNEFRVRRRPGGSPVSIETLKAMPLVTLTAKAGRSVLHFGLMGGLVRTEPAESGVRPLRAATSEDLDELPDPAKTAVVYRAALLMGLPPTTALAVTLKIEQPTAAKRVQAARRAGWLEPTTKGRKGA